tara:strand:+ start:86 stop:391 length:306 start_codon:yes stop_codon:yes gene_type:complete
MKIVGNPDLPYSLNEFTRNGNDINSVDQNSPGNQKPFFKSSIYNVSSNSVSLKAVSKYSAVNNSRKTSIVDAKSQNKFNVRKDSSTVKPTLSMQIGNNKTI